VRIHESVEKLEHAKEICIQEADRLTNQLANNSDSQFASSLRRSASNIEDMISKFAGLTLSDSTKIVTKATVVADDAKEEKDEKEEDKDHTAHLKARLTRLRWTANAALPKSPRNANSTTGTEIPTKSSGDGVGLGERGDQNEGERRNTMPAERTRNASDPSIISSELNTLRDGVKQEMETLMEKQKKATPENPETLLSCAKLLNSCNTLANVIDAYAEDVAATDTNTATDPSAAVSATTVAAATVGATDMKSAPVVAAAVDGPEEPGENTSDIIAAIVAASKADDSNDPNMPRRTGIAPGAMAKKRQEEKDRVAKHFQYQQNIGTRNKAAPASQDKKAAPAKFPSPKGSPSIPKRTTGAIPKRESTTSTGAAMGNRGKSASPGVPPKQLRKTVFSSSPADRSSTSVDADSSTGRRQRGTSRPSVAQIRGGSSAASLKTSMPSIMVLSKVEESDSLRNSRIDTSNTNDNDTDAAKITSARPKIASARGKSASPGIPTKAKSVSTPVPKSKSPSKQPPPAKSGKASSSVSPVDGERRPKAAVSKIKAGSSSVIIPSVKAASTKPVSSARAKTVATMGKSGFSPAMVKKAPSASVVVPKVNLAGLADAQLEKFANVESRGTIGGKLEDTERKELLAEIRKFSAKAAEMAETVRTLEQQKRDVKSELRNEQTVFGDERREYAQEKRKLEAKVREHAGHIKVLEDRMEQSHLLREKMIDDYEKMHREAAADPQAAGAQAAKAIALQKNQQERIEQLEQQLSFSQKALESAKDELDETKNQHTEGVTRLQKEISTEKEQLWKDREEYFKKHQEELENVVKDYAVKLEALQEKETAWNKERTKLKNENSQWATEKHEWMHRHDLLKAELDGRSQGEDNLVGDLAEEKREMLVENWKLKKDLIETKESVTNLTEEISKLEKDRDSLEKAEAMLTVDNENALVKVNELFEQKEKYRNAASESAAQREKLRAEIRDAERRMKELQSRMDMMEETHKKEFTDQRKELEQEYITNSKLITDGLTDSKTALVSELQDVRKKLVNLQARDEIEKLQSDKKISDLTSELVLLKDEVKTAKGRLNESRLELDGSKQEVLQLQDELREIKEDLRAEKGQREQECLKLKETFAQEKQELRDAQRDRERALEQKLVEVRAALDTVEFDKNCIKERQERGQQEQQSEAERTAKNLTALVEKQEEEIKLKEGDRDFREKETEVFKAELKRAAQEILQRVSALYDGAVATEAAQPGNAENSDASSISDLDSADMNEQNKSISDRARKSILSSAEIVEASGADGPNSRGSRKRDAKRLMRKVSNFVAQVDGLFEKYQVLEQKSLEEQRSILKELAERSEAFMKQRKDQVAIFNELSRASEDALRVKNKELEGERNKNMQLGLQIQTQEQKVSELTLAAEKRAGELESLRQKASKGVDEAQVQKVDAVTRRLETTVRTLELEKAMVTQELERLKKQIPADVKTEDLLALVEEKQKVQQEAFDKILKREEEAIRSRDAVQSKLDSAELDLKQIQKQLVVAEAGKRNLLESLTKMKNETSGQYLQDHESLRQFLNDKFEIERKLLRAERDAKQEEVLSLQSQITWMKMQLSGNPTGNNTTWGDTHESGRSPSASPKQHAALNFASSTAGATEASSSPASTKETDALIQDLKVKEQIARSELEQKNALLAEERKRHEEIVNELRNREESHFQEKTNYKQRLTNLQFDVQLLETRHVERTVAGEKSSDPGLSGADDKISEQLKQTQARAESKWALEKLMLDETLDLRNREIETLKKRLQAADQERTTSISEQEEERDTLLAREREAQKKFADAMHVREQEAFAETIQIKLQLQKLQGKYDDLNARHQESIADKEQIQELLSKLKEQNDKDMNEAIETVMTRASRTNATDATDGLKEKDLRLAEKTNKIFELEHLLSQTQSKLESATAQRDKIKEAVEQAKDEREKDMQSDLERLKGQLEEKHNHEVKRLNLDKELLQNELQQVKTELSDKRRAISSDTTGDNDGAATAKMLKDLALREEMALREVASREEMLEKERAYHEEVMSQFKQQETEMLGEKEILLQKAQNQAEELHIMLAEARGALEAAESEIEKWQDANEREHRERERQHAMEKDTMKREHSERIKSKDQAEKTSKELLAQENDLLKANIEALKEELQNQSSTDAPSSNTVERRTLLVQQGEMQLREIEFRKEEQEIRRAHQEEIGELASSKDRELAEMNRVLSQIREALQQKDAEIRILSDSQENFQEEMLKAKQRAESQYSDREEELQKQMKKSYEAAQVTLQSELGLKKSEVESLRHELEVVRTQIRTQVTTTGTTKEINTLTRELELHEDLRSREALLREEQQKVLVELREQNLKMSNEKSQMLAEKDSKIAEMQRLLDEAEKKLQDNVKRREKINKVMEQVREARESELRSEVQKENRAKLEQQKASLRAREEDLNIQKSENAALKTQLNEAVKLLNDSSKKIADGESGDIKSFELQKFVNDLSEKTEDALRQRESAMRDLTLKNEKILQEQERLAAEKDKKVSNLEMQLLEAAGKLEGMEENRVNLRHELRDVRNEYEDKFIKEREKIAAKLQRDHEAEKMILETERKLREDEISLLKQELQTLANLKLGDGDATTTAHDRARDLFEKLETQNQAFLLEKQTVLTEVTTTRENAVLREKSEVEKTLRIAEEQIQVHKDALLKKDHERGEMKEKLDREKTLLAAELAKLKKEHAALSSKEQQRQQIQEDSQQQIANALKKLTLEKEALVTKRVKDEEELNKLRQKVTDPKVGQDIQKFYNRLQEQERALTKEKELAMRELALRDEQQAREKAMHEDLRRQLARQEEETRQRVQVDLQEKDQKLHELEKLLLETLDSKQKISEEREEAAEILEQVKTRQKQKLESERKDLERKLAEKHEAEKQEIELQRQMKDAENALLKKELQNLMVTKLDVELDTNVDNAFTSAFKDRLDDYFQKLEKEKETLVNQRLVSVRQEVDREVDERVQRALVMGANPNVSDDVDRKLSDSQSAELELRLQTTQMKLDMANEQREGMKEVVFQLRDEKAAEVQAVREEVERAWAEKLEAEKKMMQLETAFRHEENAALKKELRELALFRATQDAGAASETQGVAKPEAVVEKRVEQLLEHIDKKQEAFKHENKKILDEYIDREKEVRKGQEEERKSFVEKQKRLEAVIKQKSAEREILAKEKETISLEKELVQKENALLKSKEAQQKAAAKEEERRKSADAAASASSSSGKGGKAGKGASGVATDKKATRKAAAKAGAAKAPKEHEGQKQSEEIDHAQEEIVFLQSLSSSVSAAKDELSQEQQQVVEEREMLRQERELIETEKRKLEKEKELVALKESEVMRAVGSLEVMSMAQGEVVVAGDSTEQTRAAVPISPRTASEAPSSVPTAKPLSTRTADPPRSTPSTSRSVIAKGKTNAISTVLSITSSRSSRKSHVPSVASAKSSSVSIKTAEAARSKSRPREKSVDQVATAVMVSKRSELSRGSLQKSSPPTTGQKATGQILSSKFAPPERAGSEKPKSSQERKPPPKSSASSDQRQSSRERIAAQEQKERERSKERRKQIEELKAKAKQQGPGPREFQVLEKQPAEQPLVQRGLVQQVPSGVPKELPTLELLSAKEKSSLMPDHVELEDAPTFATGETLEKPDVLVAAPVQQQQQPAPGRQPATATVITRESSPELRAGLFDSIVADMHAATPELKEMDAKVTQQIQKQCIQQEHERHHTQLTVPEAIRAHTKIDQAIEKIKAVDARLGGTPAIDTGRLYERDRSPAPTSIDSGRLYQKSDAGRITDKPLHLERGEPAAKKLSSFVPASLETKLATRKSSKDIMKKGASKPVTKVPARAIDSTLENIDGKTEERMIADRSAVSPQLETSPQAHDDDTPRVKILPDEDGTPTVLGVTKMPSEKVTAEENPYLKKEPQTTEASPTPIAEKLEDEPAEAHEISESASLTPVKLVFGNDDYVEGSTQTPLPKRLLKQKPKLSSDARAQKPKTTPKTPVDSESKEKPAASKVPKPIPSKQLAKGEDAEAKQAGDKAGALPSKERKDTSHPAPKATRSKQPVKTDSKSKVVSEKGRAPPSKERKEPATLFSAGAKPKERTRPDPSAKRSLTPPTKPSSKATSSKLNASASVGALPAKAKQAAPPKAPQVFQTGTEKTTPRTELKSLATPMAKYSPRPKSTGSKSPKASPTDSPKLSPKLSPKTAAPKPAPKSRSVTPPSTVKHGGQQPSLPQKKLLAKAASKVAAKAKTQQESKDTSAARGASDEEKKRQRIENELLKLTAGIVTVEEEKTDLSAKFYDAVKAAEKSRQGRDSLGKNYETLKKQLNQKEEERTKEAFGAGVVSDEIVSVISSLQGKISDLSAQLAIAQKELLTKEKTAVVAEKNLLQKEREYHRLRDERNRRREQRAAQNSNAGSPSRLHPLWQDFGTMPEVNKMEKKELAILRTEREKLNVERESLLRREKDLKAKEKHLQAIEKRQRAGNRTEERNLVSSPRGLTSPTTRDRGDRGRAGRGRSSASSPTVTSASPSQRGASPTMPGATSGISRKKFQMRPPAILLPSKPPSPPRPESAGKIPHYMMPLGGARGDGTSRSISARDRMRERAEKGSKPRGRRPPPSQLRRPPGQDTKDATPKRTRSKTLDPLELPNFLRPTAASSRRNLETAERSPIDTTPRGFSKLHQNSMKRKVKGGTFKRSNRWGPQQFNTFTANCDFYTTHKEWVKEQPRSHTPKIAGAGREGQTSSNASSRSPSRSRTPIESNRSRTPMSQRSGKGQSPNSDNSSSVGRGATAAARRGRQPARGSNLLLPPSARSGRSASPQSGASSPGTTSTKRQLVNKSPHSPQPIMENALLIEVDDGAVGLKPTTPGRNMTSHFATPTISSHIKERDFEMNRDVWRTLTEISSGTPRTPRSSRSGRSPPADSRSPFRSGSPTTKATAKYENFGGHSSLARRDGAAPAPGGSVDRSFSGHATAVMRVVGPGETPGDTSVMQIVVTNDVMELPATPSGASGGKSGGLLGVGKQLSSGNSGNSGTAINLKESLAHVVSSGDGVKVLSPGLTTAGSIATAGLLANPRRNSSLRAASKRSDSPKANNTKQATRDSSQGFTGVESLPSLLAAFSSKSPADNIDDSSNGDLVSQIAKWEEERQKLVNQQQQQSNSGINSELGATVKTGRTDVSNVTTILSPGDVLSAEAQQQQQQQQQKNQNQQHAPPPLPITSALPLTQHNHAPVIPSKRVLWRTLVNAKVNEKVFEDSGSGVVGGALAGGQVDASVNNPAIIIAAENVNINSSNRSSRSKSPSIKGNSARGSKSAVGGNVVNIGNSSDGGPGLGRRRSSLSINKTNAKPFLGLLSKGTGVGSATDGGRTDTDRLKRSDQGIDF